MSYPYIPDTLEHLAIPLDDVHPYPGNSRRGDVEKIAKSIAAHGQYRPVVINRREIAGQSNIALCGNHTWRGMLLLREKPPKKRPPASHIAATFVDVDEVTAAKINLIDNRLGDDAGYDEQALYEQLKELGDLEDSGYDPKELEDLWSKLDETPQDWPTLKPTEEHHFTCRYKDEDEPDLLRFLGTDSMPTPNQLAVRVMERIRER